MPFLQFASRVVIEQNAHDLPQVAFANIYARDGLRCICPVCGRRHPTPHHKTFRSHGGTDDPDNLISLCLECHLRGVHGGHISVTGDIGNLLWRIGKHTIVQGRTRTRFF